jgi:DNA mismatch repair ATPase MutS
MEDDNEFGTHTLIFGNLNIFMKIDSKAADAVNLFPKADDPSTYGSIYGILNRCKTKMGQRLLER